jgi:hypothetical protein
MRVCAPSLPLHWCRSNCQTPIPTAAAEDALSVTTRQIALYQGVDLILDGLSLASIFFLAAIGLMANSS